MTGLHATAPPPLLILLDGLIALQRAGFAAHPGKRDRAFVEAGDLADTITEAGDRLTASGNFTAPADRQTRGELLTVMATCLALGAEQPGGIDWGGAHWCTAPHPDCPNT
ncbi:hypothetical protein ACIGW8_22225 [Streptomyces sioyaensis]|uniref:hypothetical protein n=1 Tax=Streptomyces sioyaensis TaxID=67364 RepID=UPI0037D56584